MFASEYPFTVLLDEFRQQGSCRKASREALFIIRERRLQQGVQ